MQQAAKVETFIKLKDHKDNFPNKPTYRLLNHTNSDITKKIIKHILKLYTQT